MAGSESARHLQAQVQTRGGRAQGETQVRETGVSEKRYRLRFYAWKRCKSGLPSRAKLEYTGHLWGVLAGEGSVHGNVQNSLDDGRNSVGRELRRPFTVTGLDSTMGNLVE
jgi:hypothetical protein